MAGLVTVREMLENWSAWQRAESLHKLSLARPGNECRVRVSFDPKEAQRVETAMLALQAFDKSAYQAVLLYWAPEERSRRGAAERGGLSRRQLDDGLKLGEGFLGGMLLKKVVDVARQ